MDYWKLSVCGGNTSKARVVSSWFLRWFGLGTEAFFVVGFWWLWDISDLPLILTTSLTNLVCPKRFAIPLVLFNLSESRDEILFKEGRFVTP
jgi:hypothetical protein